jgi:hypothetical protein
MRMADSDDRAREEAESSSARIGGAVTYQVGFSSCPCTWENTFDNEPNACLPNVASTVPSTWLCFRTVLPALLDWRRRLHSLQRIHIKVHFVHTLFKTELKQAVPTSDLVRIDSLRVFNDTVADAVSITRANAHP